MKQPSRLDLLLSPLFLSGLITLLLNDLVLKYELGNWVTGKLSDIAGLFIFPFFLAVLFPKRIRPIYIGTAVLFIFWNSALSEPFIRQMHTFGIPISRTIDATDFIAFICLPLSYQYYRRLISKPIRPVFKPAITLIAGITVFSFVATTLPRHVTSYNMASGKTFVLDMDKEEFFNQFEATGYSEEDRSSDLLDSLFYFNYYGRKNGLEMKVLATVLEEDSKTIVRLDSILTGSVHIPMFRKVKKRQAKKMQDISLSDHEEDFEKFFIQKFATNNPVKNYLFYQNKRKVQEILENFRNNR